jgi:hypothetical protein
VHGGDARCVDEAFDAGLAGHAQQFAGAVDVGAIHGGGIGNPETVISGDVDDGVAIGECWLERGRVGEIADDSFATNAFEIGEVAGFAAEETQVGAFGSEGFGYVMADKTGGACDEDLHRIKAITILNCWVVQLGLRAKDRRADGIPLECLQGAEMYYWIHIVPSHSPTGPRFMFSVANMRGPGGSVPYVTFDSVDSLTASMRSINVGEADISKMQNVLAIGKAFSLPNVSLSDQDLAKLGLFVLGKQKFSAISAVEGLKLDSEGAERMERTQDLPSEKRRAETIQAFVQSRNRE